MCKASIRALLAMATLAALGSVVAAANETLTTIEPLPFPTHAKTKVEGDVHEAFQRQADTYGPRSPATEFISDDGTPFVADGWASTSVCDYDQSGCGGGCSDTNCCDSCDDCGKCKITADVELMALSTHFGEDALGKLGERYEMSERITLGVENSHGIGGRIRYWTYDRTTPNLQGGSDLRADFDVIDLEGTTRFGNKYFDLVAAGGVRWADIKIDIDQGRTRNDMPGVSLGLDVRGLLCRDCENGLDWHTVFGGRWSIFGGDWECSRGLIAPTRDDNLTVTEIYGGVECSCCFHNHEWFTRLVFESQNWRSDALGANTGVDSIGFLGPGLYLGVNR